MKKDTTNELIEVVFSIFRLMKHEMSYTHNVTHLSILQIQTLMFVKNNVNASMSDIAEHFHIELPSATSLINILCDQKLVSRSEDSKDRRLVRIALTEEGKTLLEQAMCHRRKKVEKMLSYLKDKEKGELLNILQTLRSRLQK